MDFFLSFSPLEFLRWSDNAGAASAAAPPTSEASTAPAAEASAAPTAETSAAPAAEASTASATEASAAPAAESLVLPLPGYRLPDNSGATKIWLGAGRSTLELRVAILVQSSWLLVPILVLCQNWTDE